MASERVDQHEIKEKVKSWLMPPLNIVILRFSQFTLLKVTIFIPVPSIFSMLKLPLEFFFNFFFFFEIWSQLQSIKYKQAHPLSPELWILWHQCKLHIQKSVLVSKSGKLYNIWELSFGRLIFLRIFKCTIGFFLQKKSPPSKTEQRECLQNIELHSHIYQSCKY